MSGSKKKKKSNKEKEGKTAFNIEFLVLVFLCSVYLTGYERHKDYSKHNRDAEDLGLTICDTRQ